MKSRSSTLSKEVASTTQLSSETEKFIDKYFFFLLEIRKRLLFVFSLFVVSSVVGFIFYEKIIAFIIDFFSLDGVNIVFTSPFQFFTLAINSGLIIGVIITIPVLIYQLLSFLRPALKPREYRKIVATLPLASLLFVGGFIYGVTMMKYILQIFYETSTKLRIGNVLDVESLLSKILVTGLLMGVSFLFPIVMTVLLQLRIVDYKFFTNQRSLAYIIACLFVVFLPPPDIFSDIILVAPLVILFEFTLILNRVFLKAR